MPITRKLRAWVVGLAAFSGCYSLQECVDEQIASLTNCHRAKMAWCACRPNYVECQDNLWDFGSGFRKGYEDVLNGVNRCTPPFPPRCYWGICHQNMDGRCAAAAWFDGYHHGVAVALADGYGGFNELPYSGCMTGNCGPKAVNIDLDAYKASQNGMGTPAMMDNGLPPVPETIPGLTPAQPGLPDYSPNILPAPPAEAVPKAAMVQPPLPVE